MTILLVQSHYGEANSVFTWAEAQGLGIICRERDLTAEHFAQATGMLTTTHLNQNGFMAWRADYEALLKRGGRWLFNGHIMRPLLEGLLPFQPIRAAKRADLALTDLGEHPIFGAVSRTDLEVRRGVVGFYGRGHNPMPVGARAITGVSPSLFPLDWEWVRPEGGVFFSHSGNDIGAIGGDNPLQDQIGRQLLAWLAGEN